MARSLGWGGGYSDEPLGPIMKNINAAKKIKFDRWLVTTKASDGSKDSIAMNNYFSMGMSIFWVKILRKKDWPDFFRS